MNGAKLLDLGLVLILALSFLTGARRGLLVAIFGLVGYVIGAVGGMALTRQLLNPTDSQLKRTLLTALIVLFLASIGNIVMTRVAGAVKKVVLLGPFRFIDSILGGAVSVLSVVLMIWFLATLGNLVGSADISSLLKRSVVVNQVEQDVPHSFTTWARSETGRLLGWFQSTVRTIPNL